MLKAVANTPNAANAIGPGGASGVTPLSIAKSAVAVSGANDTNENTLATITVPAGAMGPNGFVRITTIWTVTNNANVKTIRVKFGGTNYHVVSMANLASAQLFTSVRNRNSASSQVAFANSATSFTTGTGACVTSAVDTTAAVSILLTVQKATGTDTMTLEAYDVEVIYGA